nr:unnamed protein product [Spirometra erinaceieuropaei]
MTAPLSHTFDCTRPAGHLAATTPSHYRRTLLQLLHEMPTNDVAKSRTTEVTTAPMPVNSINPALFPYGIPGFDAASMSQLLLAQMCTGMTAPPTTPPLPPSSPDDQQQFMLKLYKLLASSFYLSAFEKLLSGSVPHPMGPTALPTVNMAGEQMKAEETALKANPLAFLSLFNTSSSSSSPSIPPSAAANSSPLTSANSLVSSSASCSPDLPMNLSKSMHLSQQPQPGQPGFLQRDLISEPLTKTEAETNIALPRVSQWLHSIFMGQGKTVFPDSNEEGSPILTPSFPVTVPFDGSSTVCSDEDEVQADGRPSHSSWPIRHRSSTAFRTRRSPKRVHRLWQFLWTLLEDPTYNPSIIRWVDREAKMFELTKSSVVANLWGAQKQKPGMSYENLGRSLRYYYSRKILKKVSGQRLVYQFLPTDALLACEQSQPA